VFSPGSAETNVRLGGKLNGHVIASCVRNICTKNDQNLITVFQVTVKNVGDIFETQCRVLGEANSRNFVILACAVLIQSLSVTDGRADRQTDAQAMA